MQKFSDYEYIHIDFDTKSTQAMSIIEKMKKAENFDSFKQAVIEFNHLYIDIISSVWLCEIRHSVDTLDKFYSSEQKYYDKTMPAFLPVFNTYCAAIINSKFRSEIQNEWGEHLITICEYQLKSMDMSIIGYLQQENALSGEYQKMMAASQIEFMGQTHTLPSLMKYFENPDREIRKNALKAFNDFLEAISDNTDELFDKLVKLRTQMGRAMGYDNYLPLGYIRMRRYDYNEEDIKRLRTEVKTTIVPLCFKLKQQQAKRIGVDKLMFYDDTYNFPDGNPELCTNADNITLAARQMFSEIGPITKEFFNFMCDSELLDLKSKKNKAMGGFCSAIPNKKAPFIFANFNSTSADAEVFTHEAGHALNTWLVMHEFDNMQLAQSTYEVAEIHSTAMEFLTSPYMNKFFSQQSDKYLFLHLYKTVTFLAYGTLVDEFQHIIYRNPDMTDKDRRLKWRELEKQYLPYIDYGDNETLNGGAYWYRQLHIFMHPLYYIDYVLASLSALEIYNIMKSDEERAWEIYNKLSSLGASLPYRELLKTVGLSCPLDGGVIEKIIEPLYDELKWNK